MKRLDHAEAASRFIASEKHEAFHDQRLWDLRKKRDREAHRIPEWEELRDLASAIKEHTLTHLADYLEEFERKATAIPYEYGPSYAQGSRIASRPAILADARA
jgi:L-lactate dehydrogenase complex protein LldF